MQIRCAYFHASLYIMNEIIKLFNEIKSNIIIHPITCSHKRVLLVVESSQIIKAYLMIMLLNV